MTVLGVDPYLTACPRDPVRVTGRTPARGGYHLAPSSPDRRDAGIWSTRPALRRMKPTALLVNTARGGLVDTDALVARWQEGRIGGAALDTLEAGADPGRLSPLRFPNVILSRMPAGIRISPSGGSEAQDRRGRDRGPSGTTPVLAGESRRVQAPEAALQGASVKGVVRVRIARLSGPPLARLGPTSGTGQPCSGGAARPGRVAPWVEACNELRGPGGHGVYDPLQGESATGTPPAGRVPNRRLGVARRVRGSPDSLDLYGDLQFTIRNSSGDTACRTPSRRSVRLHRRGPHRAGPPAARRSSVGARARGGDCQPTTRARSGDRGDSTISGGVWKTIGNSLRTPRSMPSSSRRPTIRTPPSCATRPRRGSTSWSRNPWRWTPRRRGDGAGGRGGGCYADGRAEPPLFGCRAGNGARLPEIGDIIRVHIAFLVSFAQPPTDWWRSSAQAGGLVHPRCRVATRSTASSGGSAGRPQSIYATAARTNPAWEGEDEADIVCLFFAGGDGDGPPVAQHAPADSRGPGRRAERALPFDRMAGGAAFENLYRLEKNGRFSWTACSRPAFTRINCGSSPMR